MNDGFSGINRELAQFLAGCIIEAYQQFSTGGAFGVPAGYRMLGPIMSGTGEQTKLYGYMIESVAGVLIVFRGTRTVGEWLTDFDIRQVEFPYVDAGRTHSGFTELYGVLRPSILRGLQFSPHWKRVVVTGHSLGGALATLAALDIMANTLYYNLSMYNFGSPKVGDPQFATVYDQKVQSSFRIANLFDPVPKVPPEQATLPFSQEVVTYQHVSRAVHIFIHTGSLIQNHDIRTYLQGIGGDKSDNNKK